MVACVISGEHDARIDWSWIHLDMGMGLKTGLETLESGLYLTGSRTPLVRLDGLATIAVNRVPDQISEAIASAKTFESNSRVLKRPPSSRDVIDRLNRLDPDFSETLSLDLSQALNHHHDHQQNRAEYHRTRQSAKDPFLTRSCPAPCRVSERL
ncbi:Protein CMS1 [Fusarium oxysporum f. sp. albedinis]|nr:Protein CMS1 [Fusarium oxysporum f. sp. albedinis]